MYCSAIDSYTSVFELSKCAVFLAEQSGAFDNAMLWITVTECHGEGNVPLAGILPRTTAAAAAYRPSEITMLNADSALKKLYLQKVVQQTVICHDDYILTNLGL